MNKGGSQLRSDADLPLWKKLLFSTLTLAIVLFTMELVAHVYLRAFEGFDGEHLTQHTFDPYKNIVPTPGYRDTRGVTHNGQGFRRTSEVARSKQEGAIRVFLMGGSTAYGTGGLWPHVDPRWPVLHDTVTISEYLERSLAQRFPERSVEVINAAIVSTWTHHELIYLNQTVLSFDPDLIIFLDGFNDFFRPNVDHDQFASYAYGEQAPVIMGPPTLRSLATANLWWLYRRSAAFYLASRTARSLWRATRQPPRVPMSPDAAMQGLREVFPRSALRMVERNVMITEAAGAEAMFVLQPILILERERQGLTGVEGELFQFYVDSYLPGYEQFMLQAAPYVSSLTREVVLNRAGTYLDATTAFEGAEGQMFTDYAHLTPEGNRILASLIESAAIPLLEAAIAR